MKQKLSHTKLALFTALITLIGIMSAKAASMVEVTFKVDGKVIGKTLYSGKDGGTGTKNSTYWSLLSKPPMFGSDMKIKADKAGGTEATLKGRIEISITIRNKFSKGVAQTDKLELIRKSGKTNGWYFSKTELKRVEALVKEENEKDALTLLKDGQLPPGFVLRLHADMWSTKDDADKKLREHWEFTADRVYRIKREKVEGRYIERRAETRPFDSENLCADLLAGKIFLLHEPEETGDHVLFAGTGYDLGARSIELYQNDQLLIDLAESCAFAGSFTKEEGVAFTALYEKLAKQARDAFQSKPAPE